MNIAEQLFKPPFRCLVLGNSQSGKSYMVSKLM